MSHLMEIGPGDWDPEDMDDPEYLEDRGVGIDPEEPDLDGGSEGDGSWDVEHERAELEDAMLEMEVDEAVAKLEAEEAGEDEDWDDDDEDEYGDEDDPEDADSGFEDVDVEQLPDERQEDEY